MVRMVLADLWSVRKEGIKKSLTYAILCTAYFSCLIASWINWEGWQKGVTWFIESLLFAFMMMLHNLYPNQIKQALFLSPMTREDRKQYLYILFAIKLVLVCGLQGIISVAFVHFGRMFWWQGILLVLCFGLWTAVMGLGNYARNGITLYEERKRMYLNTVRMDLCHCVSGFLCLILLGIEGEEMLWEKILIAGLVLLQIFLCGGILKKEFAYYIARGMDYERTKQIERVIKGGKAK